MVAIQQFNNFTIERLSLSGIVKWFNSLIIKLLRCFRPLVSILTSTFPALLYSGRVQNATDHSITETDIFDATATK